MLASSRSLFRISLYQLVNTVQRCEFFTEFETKLQRFEKQVENLKKENINLIESQKVVEDLVKKAKLDQPKDIELVQTHLLHVIHLGDTSHIPIILQSLIALERSGIKHLKFHTSFARLAHRLNSIDVIIELFKNTEWKRYFLKEDIKIMILVLDKLVEEKRFDDVWKFYCDHVSKLEQIPSSFLNAVTFSLMNQKSAESFSKIKELVSFCDKRRQLFGVNSIVQIFMAAIEQSICYSCLDQPVQALAYAKSAIEIYRTKDSYQGFLFRTTMKFLEESVSRSKNDQVVNHSYEELKGMVERDKSKFLDEDILEFHSRSTEGTFTNTFKPEIRSNYGSWNSDSS